MSRFFSILVVFTFVCFSLNASPLFIQSHDTSKELVYINDQVTKVISDIKLEKNRIEERALEVQAKNEELFFILTVVALSSLFVVCLLGIVVRKKIAQYKNLYLESNHRIKNNIGAIDYFISKKKDETASEALKTDLSEIQSKLHSFYKIHESLVINESSNHIVLKDYLADLLQKTAQSFGRDKVFFETEMKTSIHIDVNKSCVLGMILNEFITNSISHATFYGIPNIFVSLEESGKCITLKLMETNKSRTRIARKSKGTQKGLNLVKNLCKQIDAKLVTDNNSGTQMLITLDR